MPQVQCSGKTASSQGQHSSTTRRSKNAKPFDSVSILSGGWSGLQCAGLQCAASSIFRTNHKFKGMTSMTLGKILPGLRSLLAAVQDQKEKLKKRR